MWHKRNVKHVQNIVLKSRKRKKKKILMVKSVNERDAYAVVQDEINSLWREGDRKKQTYGSVGRTIGRTEEEREKENKRKGERYRETERKEKRKEDRWRQGDELESRVLVELIQISGGLGDGGSAEKPSRRMLFWWRGVRHHAIIPRRMENEKEEEDEGDEARPKASSIVL